MPYNEFNEWCWWNIPQPLPPPPDPIAVYKEAIARAHRRQKARQLGRDPLMTGGLDQIEARLKMADVHKIDEEEGEMINTFKVGTDPEFILLDGLKKPLLVSQYFPHDGPIGFDHGGRVAEYRPGPSKGVLLIIRKIQELVKETREKVPNAKLRAGAICGNECLGGHVHFGFNAFEIKPPAGCGSLTGGKFNAQGAATTKALDALTKALEHLDILPSTECVKRRASAQGQGYHYGAYGDVRDCNGHMEYRTMASWLYDPKIAFLCLTAAKLAAVDPAGTFEALNTCTSFSAFAKWVEGFKGKDANAKRVVEKLLDAGHKQLQIDPELDFGERWQTLGGLV